MLLHCLVLSYLVLFCLAMYLGYIIIVYLLFLFSWFNYNPAPLILFVNNNNNNNDMIDMEHMPDGPTQSCSLPSF